VGAYGPRTERAVGTMYEPSATEPTEVILEARASSTKETTIDVQVGGGSGSEIINVVKSGVAKEGSVYTFIVPAGKEWGVAANTVLESLFTLYLPLG